MPTSKWGDGTACAFAISMPMMLVLRMQASCQGRFALVKTVPQSGIVSCGMMSRPRMYAILLMTLCVTALAWDMLLHRGRRTQIMLITASCQCEHICHFGRKHSPNGNPGHKYGMKYAISYLVRLNASFTVCKDCAKDCHAKV